MVDLRRQLDLLHGNDAAAHRQPGLANLDEVIDSARTAGLHLAVDLPAEPPALPPSLDVTVFRIVQELLTNALRHGDGTASLRIHGTDRHVVIEQSNPFGDAYDGESAHRGLHGIRRRAEIFGGTMRTTDAGGRWSITVDLPIEAL